MSCRSRWKENPSLPLPVPSQRLNISVLILAEGITDLHRLPQIPSTPAAQADQITKHDKMHLFLFLTSFSMAALAATSAESTAATCVTSSVSSANTSTLLGYTEVEAPVTGTGYDIDPSFVAAHAFNSTMVCKSAQPPIPQNT